MDMAVTNDHKYSVTNQCNDRKEKEWTDRFIVTIWTKPKAKGVWRNNYLCNWGDFKDGLKTLKE